MPQTSGRSQTLSMRGWISREIATCRKWWRPDNETGRILQASNSVWKSVFKPWLSGQAQTNSEGHDPRSLFLAGAQTTKGNSAIGRHFGSAGRASADPTRPISPTLAWLSTGTSEPSETSPRPDEGIWELPAAPSHPAEISSDQGCRRWRLAGCCRAFLQTERTDPAAARKSHDR